MIGVPRFWRIRTSVSPHHVGLGVALVRHVACTALLAGCLYPFPINRQPDDAPLRMISPPQSQIGQPIPRMLRQKLNFISVVAMDTDGGETLDVEWTLGTMDITQYERLSDVDGATATFTIKLPLADELNGELLEATVFSDLESTTVTFLLETS